jgi:protein SCO1/2
MGLGVLAGLVLALGLFFSRPYTLRGSVIQDPTTAPQIEMTDTNGRPFNLAEQQGKLVLLFFGYTSCPDVCPATLAQWRQLHDQLGDKADEVVFVYITVDPDRDTPERVREHLALFNPDFVGLTGSEEELQPVWANYWVYREIQDDQPTALGYLVAHSAHTYVIDRQGRLRMTFAYGTNVEDMEADIRFLLKEG